MSASIDSIQSTSLAAMLIVLNFNIFDAMMLVMAAKLCVCEFEYLPAENLSPAILINVYEIGLRVVVVE